MKKVLNFVRGAVAEKELIPVLTHFNIEGGRIQGGNGKITIDAPAPPELADMTITVPAIRFLKAVDACDEEPVMKVTEAGNLTMKRGSFRATLPLTKPEEFPSVERTEGERYAVSGLLPVLTRLRPFIGNDASRKWACAVLFDDEKAFATNNVLLVRSPCNIKQRVVVPVYAIDELLRIGKEPDSVVVGETSIMFEYDDTSWMRAQLFNEDWPDVDALIKGTNEPVPSGLIDAVNKVLPFCPDQKQPVINFGEDGVSTNEGAFSANENIGELPTGIFRAETLLLALSVAERMDLSEYPKPIPFEGNNITGVLAGMVK